MWRLSSLFTVWSLTSFFRSHTHFSNLLRRSPTHGEEFIFPAPSTFSRLSDHVWSRAGRPHEEEEQRHSSWQTRALLIDDAASPTKWWWTGNIYWWRRSTFSPTWELLIICWSDLRHLLMNLRYSLLFSFCPYSTDRNGNRISSLTE